MPEIDVKGALVALSGFIEEVDAFKVQVEFNDGKSGSDVDGPSTINYCAGDVSIYLRDGGTTYTVPLALVVGESTPVAAPIELPQEIVQYALQQGDQVGHGRWDSLEELHTEMTPLREGVRPVAINLNTREVRELEPEEISHYAAIHARSTPDA